MLKRIGYGLILLGLGAAIGISLGVQLLGIRLASAKSYVFYLALILVGAALAYGLIWKIIRPGLRRYSKIQAGMWMLFSFLAGCLVVLTFPLMVYPKVNQVQILAEAQKNPQSAGSEVRPYFFSAGSKFGPIILNEVCQGDWYVQEALPVFNGQSPSALTCQVEADNRIGVTFFTTPQSGLVKVILGDQTAVLDLYSATEGDTSISLPVFLTGSEVVRRDLLFVLHGLAAGLGILALSLWLVNVNLPNAVKKKRRLAWWAYDAPMAVFWAISLMAFWPGIMSPDSIDQFTQAFRAQFYDWHPAIHTMLIWLLTRAWFSPAPVVIVQILAMSAVLGWGLSSLEGWGAPRLLAILSGIFLAISPAIALMTLTVWKDVLYSAAVAALTICIVQIVYTRGKWLEASLHWIGLGFCAALVCLFRHNGVLVGFGALILLLAAYPRRWRKVLPALALAVVVWIGVRGPLYHAVGVNTKDAIQGTQPAASTLFADIIDWHIRYGTQVETETRQLKDEIFPKNGPRNNEAIVEHAQELKNAAINLSLRAPYTALKFFLWRSTFIFQVIPPDGARIDNVGFDIFPNELNLSQTPIIPHLKSFFISYTSFTEKLKVEWLVWRNAFWMYLTAFLTILAAVRARSWKILLLIAPLLLNALPYSFYNGGHVARYILPTLIIGPLLAPSLLFLKQSEEFLAGTSASLAQAGVEQAQVE
jgi:hypothetical protein